VLDFRLVTLLVAAAWQKRVSSAGSVGSGHMTPTQRGNLIIEG